MNTDQYEENRWKLEGEAPEEEQSSWKVDSDEKAEWAMLKIKESQEEFDRRILLCNKIIAEYNQTKLEIEKQYHRDTDYFKSQLKNYFDSVPHKTTKTQESYALGLGKLVLKKQKPEAKVDNVKLAEWLVEKANWDYIETKQTPKWGELKKTLTQVDSGYVTADGEIVEGVELQERDDKFDVVI